MVIRQETGRYEVRRLRGELVRAFIPNPLPPTPSLVLEGPLQQSLERTTLALGRLDTISVLLPQPSLFIYAYVRKEAVLSSQIEGTQASISDLLRFEEEGAVGAPLEDVVEVSNYVRALEHGLERMRGGFPLSNRLLREIHGVLLSRGRGSDKLPGEFRRSQNWIGGTRPGNAVFVPPPPTEIERCMGDLESFLHSEADGLPWLVRAALAHVQFETIHPFLDGNGRIGRLLITLLLCHAGVLREPLLYLSLYLKQNRLAYYDHLEEVRRTGAWEKWLDFFLEGVRAASESAVATAQRLTAMFSRDRAAIERMSGQRASSALRIHQALTHRPVLSIAQAGQKSGLSFVGASSAMKLLERLRIVQEITGRQRNRLFAYAEYVSVLNEGTEPL